MRPRISIRGILPPLVGRLVRWLVGLLVVKHFFKTVNLAKRSLVIILDSSLKMPFPPLPFPCPRPLPRLHPFLTRTHRCSSQTCFLMTVGTTFPHKTYDNVKELQPRHIVYHHSPISVYVQL